MSNQNIKYLGIDFGTVRIGLALGDSETRMASPLTVVANMNELIQIAKHEEVDELVVGSPISMSGKAEQMKEVVDMFLLKLRTELDLPIHMVDERLSSKAADALIGDKKTKADRDAVAAMLILQSYLDKI